MKGVIGFGLALALTLAVVPAAGAGETFHAFHAVPAAARAGLVPLPEAQLGAVEAKSLLGNWDVFWQILQGWGLPAITTRTDAQLMVNSQHISQQQSNRGGASQSNQRSVSSDISPR
jgi:hypothetical protein